MTHRNTHQLQAEEAHLVVGSEVRLLLKTDGFLHIIVGVVVQLQVLLPRRERRRRHRTAIT